jgi:hypothetical protein
MKICDAGHVEIIYEEYTRGRRIACPVCDAKTEIDAYLKEIDRLKAENEKFYRDFDEIDRFLEHHRDWSSLIRDLLSIRDAQKEDK